MIARICNNIETWYRTWCPYCDTTNFICNGNESDLSGLDKEAVECHKCHKKYWLCEPADPQQSIDDSVWEKGVVLVETTGMQTQHFITDGFGNTWSAWCPTCRKETMQVVRPGKVQCSNCG